MGATQFPDLAQYWLVNPDDGGGPTSYGAWIGGVLEKFLGIRFAFGGSEHLGFVQLSVDARDGADGPFAATISGFGYNDAAVTAARGAELITRNVPEPSPLGMLALGAAGVCAFRRRCRDSAKSSG